MVVVRRGVIEKLQERGLAIALPWMTRVLVEVAWAPLLCAIAVLAATAMAYVVRSVRAYVIGVVLMATSHIGVTFVMILALLEMVMNL